MTKGTAQKSKTTGGGKNCEGMVKKLQAQLDKAWREAVKTTTGGISIYSRFRYRDSMPTFLRFCAEKFHLEKLANVKGKHLRAYVDYRRQAGISERTLKNDLAAIRFFHKYTGSTNRLPDNKSLEIEKTPSGGRDRAWTDKEYKDMIAEAKRLGRRDVVEAMRQARLAGLRIHECTRQTVGHIEDALEKGELETVGKGGRLRRIPVSPEIRTMLEDILKEHAGGRESKIFIEPGGKKTHQEIKSIQNFIYRHRKKITDRDITFHGLRHSFAREDLEREIGGSTDRREMRAAKIRTSRKLGHGRPEVTDIYLGGKK